MNLLEKSSSITWTPGIGDPTFSGWVIVSAYLMAALLALLAWGAARPEGPRAVRGFWLVTALALFVLAVNKQLDMHSLLTQIGRAIAREGGWYEERRGVQAAFIAVLGVVALIVLVVAARSLRPHMKKVALPLVGVVFVLLHVLVRAATFHHVGHAVPFGVSEAGRHNFLEAAGLLLLTIGAWRSWLERRKATQRAV